MNYALIILLFVTPFVDGARNSLLRVAERLSPRISIATSAIFDYDTQINLLEFLGQNRIMRELSFSTDAASSSVPSSASFVPSSSPIPSSIPSNIISDSPSFVDAVEDSSEGSINDSTSISFVETSEDRSEGSIHGSTSISWMTNVSFLLILPIVLSL